MRNLLAGMIILSLVGVVRADVSQFAKDRMINSFCTVVAHAHSIHGQNMLSKFSHTQVTPSKGTGVLCYVEKMHVEGQEMYCGIVLTCAHIFEKSINDSAAVEFLSITDGSINRVFRVPALVIAKDNKLDLAAVFVAIPPVVGINPKDISMTLWAQKQLKLICESVVSCSNPRGIGPIVSEGTAGFGFTNDDIHLFSVTNLVSTHGSSGGGVFHSKSGELLGIIRAKLMTPNGENMVGGKFCISYVTIRKFLKDNALDFIIGSKYDANNNKLGHYYRVE